MRKAARFAAVMAAMVVLSVATVAFAQAPSPDPTVNDILALIAAHAWWLLGGTIVGVVLHLVSSNSDLISWINMSASARAVLAAVLTGLQMAFTGLGQGQAWAAVIVSAVLYVLPQILHFIPDLAKSKAVRQAAARGTAALVLLVCIGATQTGCPSLLTVLADVITVAQDAASVLNVITVAEKEFFLIAPNPDLQKKIDQGLIDAQLALDIAIRSTRGVQNLTSDQADAAFADFRQAYASLIELLKQAGVVSPTPDGKAYATARGRLIPTPLAMGKVGAK